MKGRCTNTYVLRASADKRRGKENMLELKRQTQSLLNLLICNHVHLKFGLYSMEKREMQVW